MLLKIYIVETICFLKRHEDELSILLGALKVAKVFVKNKSFDRYLEGLCVFLELILQ